MRARGRNSGEGVGSLTADSVMQCATMFEEQGAREKAVAVVMDAMTNATRRFWSRDISNWIVEPDHRLRGDLGLAVLHLLDGLPVSRTEHIKLVGVVQGKGDFNLEQIPDPKLRIQVAALMTRANVKDASEVKPGQPAAMPASESGAAKMDVMERGQEPTDEAVNV